MYQIITTTIRPDQSQPFFVSKDNLIEDPDAMGMLKNSPGFVDHEYVISEDGLTMNRSTTWQSEAAHYEFLFRWLDQRPNYITDFGAYNTEHNHIHVIEYKNI